MGGYDCHGGGKIVTTEVRLSQGWGVRLSRANPTEGSFVTAVNPSCFTGFDVFLGVQTSNLFKTPAKRRYIGQALIMYHLFY